jgi:hypothetical protein
LFDKQYDVIVMAKAYPEKDEVSAEQEETYAD